MKKHYLLSLLLFVASLFSFAQNNSIDFDGQNDRIFVNSSTAWNSANSLTVEAWIYADAWRANHWEGTIVAKDQSNQSGYVLRCGNNGTLSFVVGVGNGTWTEVLSAPVMQVNTWHHVVGVMDNGTLRLYIDGVASGTVASNPIATSTNSVYIGESSGFPGRVFNGRIDEVRIWNTVRTQTEIVNNMTANLPGTNANLWAYFQMDSISNNMVTNKVNTVSNGTLQNFAGTPLSGGYVLPSTDFGVVSIESPDLITIFQKYSKLKATFKNFGNDTLHSLDFGYQINSASPRILSVTQTLNPGETYTHTFLEPLPKMDSTTQLTVFTNLSGDVNPSNDTVRVTHTLPATPNTLEIPIFESVQHNFGAAGQNHFAGVVLPEANLNFGRILMELSVACPGTGCDPWDQPAKISIVKDGQTHEIVRYITPYGKACGPWTVDVTDFKTLLRGYTEFASYIQVWGSSGWLLNAKLIYDTTQVPYPYQKLTPLWASDNWVYGDPAVSYNLPARSLNIDSGATEVSMRMTITGHGQGNTLNAAEFSAFTHQVTANGSNVNSHVLWKNNCNVNSCSNQFGTWQFARAGWCPGQAVDPYMVNLTSNVPANRNLTVDYVLQSYTNNLRTGYNGGSHTEPHYKIHAYLIEKSNQFIDSGAYVDMAATAITSPTRMNLGAGTPVKVMLRNYGSVDITFPTVILLINGIHVTTEIIPVINAGDSLEHTFNYNARFVSNGSYDIAVSIYKVQSNDQVASNDVASLFIDQTVGIENIELNGNRVNLYPNPTEGGFILAGEDLNGSVDVKIINVNGQEVYHETRFANGQLEIEERFKSGVYFVELNINNEFVRKRVVVL